MAMHYSQARVMRIILRLLCMTWMPLTFYCRFSQSIVRLCVFFVSVILLQRLCLTFV